MACRHCQPRAIVCSFAHDEGKAMVGGKMYRWEYHPYLGLNFVRADGIATANQDPPRAVWREVEKWMAEREARRGP